MLSLEVVKKILTEDYILLLSSTFDVLYWIAIGYIIYSALTVLNEARKGTYKNEKN